MKRLQILVLAAVVAALMLAVTGTAFADTIDAKKDWKVTYTSKGELVEQNNSSSNVNGLQPGDSIIYEAKLIHENSKSAGWYMNNKVMEKLEEGKAEGSSYEYRLKFYPPGTDPDSDPDCDNDEVGRVLYKSEAVGGDNSAGLQEATKAGGLEDFFFLEDLSQGQSATVKLMVTLDGETEGNDYFDTIARLKMQFGVDPTKSNDNPPNNNVVRTGDDTNLFPYYVVMAVSGLALLVIAIAMVRRRRADQTGGSHAR